MGTVGVSLPATCEYARHERKQTMQQGHIFQINISQGGVPKQPIQQGIIHELGVEGDKQKHPQYHGGPDKALCLYALETILDLQREGHPIYPGSVGENLTITGIDFSELREGSTIQIGSEILIAITDPAIPCKQISASFSDGRSTRISHKVNPKDTRLYARVIQGGTVRIGDPVVVIENE